jgi:hypothetical protein
MRLTEEPLNNRQVGNAIRAVLSGTHNPNHIGTLKRTRAFLANNKTHKWNTSDNLHKAISKARIPLHAGVITRDNILEVLLEAGIDPKQLKMGIEVEKEHGDHDKSTDVTRKSDLKSRDVFKKIAMAHLKEVPDYYTRLAKMEKEGKRAANKPVSEAVEQLDEFFKDVMTYNIARHHPSFGRRASHMRPASSKKKETTPPMGRYNPDTFYPKNNMMSPINVRDTDSRAKPRSYYGDGKKRYGGKVIVGGTLAATAGAAYLYKKRQQAKRQKQKQVQEAADRILYRTR